MNKIIPLFGQKNDAFKQQKMTAKENAIAALEEKNICYRDLSTLIEIIEESDKKVPISLLDESIRSPFFIIEIEFWNLIAKLSPGIVSLILKAKERKFGNEKMPLNYMMAIIRNSKGNYEVFHKCMSEIDIQYQDVKELIDNADASNIAILLELKEDINTKFVHIFNKIVGFKCSDEEKHKLNERVTRDQIEFNKWIQDKIESLDQLNG